MYSTVLWLLELHITPDRKTETQVRTVNSNSRTPNCQCTLFKKKKFNYLDFLYIRMVRRPN